MKIKSLLLGSSAVLGVVGAAQAADAPKPAAVTKPAPVVQYVQVCDLYGLGYFVLPGQKDTCLRIQGQVQFQLNFHTTSATSRTDGTSTPHSAAWSSVATGQVTFTAKRQTDHGDLVGVVRITSTSNNRDTLGINQTALGCTLTDPTNPDDEDQTCATTGGAVYLPLDRYVQMDRAYIQVGSKFSVLMGYNSSVYGAGTTKQVMFDFDLGGGYELQLALDDPRDRWGTRLPSNYWIPDLVGNLTGNYALGTWGVSGGLAWVGTPSYGAAPGTMVWGVSGRTTIKADSIAKGDQLVLTAAYGTGCQFVTCTLSQNNPSSNGTIFQGTVGFKHVFNTKLNTNTVFQWSNPNNTSGTTGNFWQITNTTQFLPTNERNFQLQNQLRYAQTLGNTGTCATNPGVCHAWTDQVQAQYTF